MSFQKILALSKFYTGAYDDLIALRKPLLDLSKNGKESLTETARLSFLSLFTKVRSRLNLQVAESEQQKKVISTHLENLDLIIKFFTK